ncbi:MAG: 30S ribosome-binding factor RbfA [Alphaproteobacteria bacterium]|nr:30S ribosome-binding factor RbfA [Alphaproteobacteria bacterium]
MAKLHDLFSQKGSAGQRPKRVGEEIRRSLADIFLRGECNFPDLLGHSITVSEVRVAPDMKNATAFVMPLAGNNKKELLDALKIAAPELRYLVSKKMQLRYMPRIHFALDESFEVAEKIDLLLKKPEVAKDLEPK